MSIEESSASMKAAHGAKAFGSDQTLKLDAAIAREVRSQLINEEP